MKGYLKKLTVLAGLGILVGLGSIMSPGGGLALAASTTEGTAQTAPTESDGTTDGGVDGEPVGDNNKEAKACVQYSRLLGESTTRKGPLGVKITARVTSPLHCTKGDTAKNVETELYIFFTDTAEVEFGDGTKSTSPAGKLVLHCEIDHENDRVSCYWGTGFNSSGQLEGADDPADSAGIDKKSFNLEVTGGTITIGGFGPNKGSKHGDEHTTSKRGYTGAHFQFGGSK